MALLLSSALLLGGCAEPWLGRVEEPRRVGNDRDILLLRNQRLLADFDGWRAWEFTDNEIITCMAVKPAPGAAWPSFNDSTLRGLRGLGSEIMGRKDMSVVQSAAQSMQMKLAPRNEGALRRLQLDAGAGFFMFIQNTAEVPNFGFYGKYPYRLPAVATVAGKPVADPTDRDTVLSWEGQPVSFRVNTKPSDASDKQEETSGVIDFTGVRRAYDIIMACRARARAPRGS